MGIIDRKLLWLALSGTGAANLSGADALLDGEAQGLAFDFTDQSVRIIDTSTPSNSTRSTGIVNQGSLVGPGGKLTYTSPSNKLVMQSSGNITYSAHNLYLNSASPANQSITVVSGASYAVTITGTVSVTASGAATGTWTAGTNTFTAATTTLTLGSTSGSGTVHVRRTPSVSDYVATAGSIVYSLPYEYDTSGACKGMLVEEQRTNLVTYSRPQATYWDYNTTGTLTENAISSPTGETNGSLSAEGDASAFVRRASLDTITAAQHAMTVYLRYYNSQWARVIWASTTSLTNGVEAWFDIQNGATGSTTTRGTGWSISSTSIEAVGNSWYRCTCIVTAGNTTLVPAVMTASADASATRNNVGSGPGVGSGLYLQFAQAELGSFPTSPIITYGATATRAADQGSQLSSTFPLSATAGTLYVEATPFAGADLAGVVSLNDGTGNEEILIYKDASANILAQVEDGGANQLAPLDSTVNAASATTFKAALAYAANDFALSANGTAAQTDTGGTLPTVTTLEIGADQANNYFNGHIRAICYVPRRKSDSELQTETT